MRRLTLGALILGGGTLLALPFRRHPSPDASSINDANQQNVVDSYDDESLAMLVREVTKDVEVPLVFEPQTDYLPAEPTPAQQYLPLTYDDLAVPVQRDPYYEDRFNASAAVVENVENAKRIAQLEQMFAQTEFANADLAARVNGSSPTNAIPADPSLGDFGSKFTNAHLASTASSAKLAAQQESGRKSILSQLPPPDGVDGESGAERQRHWIRQPD